MKGLQFPMNSNNKIGAKCLFNLYLKVSDKGILEDASIEDVKDENSDEEKDEEEEKEKEKKDQKADEEDQEPVTTATQEEAEVGSKGEQGEALCERETSKNEEAEELDDKDSSDEEVRISVKKKPTVTPRKSRRLASKGKRPVVSSDDYSSTHTSLEPKHTAPPSPKPDTPLTHHIPSPPPSPIPSTPPPTTTTPASPLPHTSLGLGFTGCANPSVPAALSDPVLNKLQVLQS